MIVPLVLFGMIGIQSSFAEETLDFKACKGVLSIEEAKNVIGQIDDVTVYSSEVLPVDSEPGLQTICELSLESSGKNISITLVVMESAEDANALYEKNLDSMTGQDFEMREYVTFWNNFDVVLNDQGVGSFMVSQYDKFFINIHTNLDENNQTLADVEQIRTLSTIVQKKILDLDEVTISPPNPTPNLDDPDRFKPEHETPPIEIGELLSPKKQISQGVDPPAVKCKEGLFLVLKFSDNSPACVKQSSVDILYERGWGGAAPPCCKPTEVSSITNFEECIAAGNPAMESYPRQCRTVDGKHFVETIPENKECEMIGGIWGIWGNAVDSAEQCNPPTSDKEAECTDSSQCQSYCQAKEGSEIDSKDSGNCYGYELAICMQEVVNGVVQPEWCQ